MDIIYYMFKLKDFINNTFEKLFPKKPDFGNIVIGEYTYGQPLILDWTHKYRLKIGKFCSIAGNVQILLDGNHRPDWVATYPFYLIEGVPKTEGHPSGRGDMNIGNDVWIGRNVIVLPGVSIGNGAVVGAGSVVTKNVEKYSIVAGNPARPIRYRFTSEQIEKLEKIKWWDWDIAKIKKMWIYYSPIILIYS